MSQQNYRNSNGNRKRTVKRSNTNKKQRRGKVRKDRLAGALILVGLAGFGVVKGIDAVKGGYNKIVHGDSIYFNEEQASTEELFNSDSLDNFSAGEYVFSKDAELKIKDSETGNFVSFAMVPKNQTCLVYDFQEVRDNDNKPYYYCEDYTNNIIGLVSEADLDEATRLGTKTNKFSTIYQVDTSKESGIALKTSSKSSEQNIRVLKDGEILFAEEKDDESLKVRSSDGDIGYLSSKKGLKEIEDVVLVQIVNDVNKIQQYESVNLSQNVENAVVGVDSGDRLVVIGDGKNPNSSNVIYFDRYGIARNGEISNELIQTVELDKFQGFELEGKEDINSTLEMNQAINNWRHDITSGACGIDISGMTPETLDLLLKENPDIEFGVVKLGATGYDYEQDNLLFSSSNITKSEEQLNKVKSQIEILKRHGKKVMAYYFATDKNFQETEKVVVDIETSIDLLGGGITPILDYEFSSEEKEYDRNYWVRKPNYDKYLAQGNIPLDFDTIENLDAVDRMNYVKSHSEVVDYINFCQTEKARCIAHTYKRLYEDGYMTGENAILYTGNGHFSKDTYKAVIKDSEVSSYESVVLAKFDEVEDLLTNPKSTEYTPMIKNFKVWNADYTGQNNSEVYGSDCAIVQVRGDILFNGEKYDKNYACREFIEKIPDNTRIRWNNQDNQIKYEEPEWVEPEDDEPDL